MINVVVLGIGLLAVVGFTGRLLEGRRPSDLEWLFGWDFGSWWWAGQVVVIVGWCLIVYVRARDLIQWRSRTGISTK